MLGSGLLDLYKNWFGVKGELGRDANSKGPNVNLGLEYG
jgi:hypothetical protein